MKDHNNALLVAVLGGGLGVCVGFALARAVGHTRRKRCVGDKGTALEALIGNTPLVELKSLSALTGCTILGKAEFLNPGGSVKDRVAQGIVDTALHCGRLAPGGTIVEGTAGSTGISLAMMARAKGLKCCIYMPDDQAVEKSDILSRLGAEVNRVRPVSIVDPQQFCNLAEHRANHDQDAVYCDQFENPANFQAHYHGTGREIWEQCDHRVDAFVAASGTGGTIAGVSRFLKDQDPSVRVFLIDPPGSSLYNRVRRGVLFAVEEKEGMKARHQVDSIMEGIGINRLTNNFLQASIDDAFRGTDQEAVEMAQFLLEREGLFVGSSSAMNCVGAVKAARRLGPGHRIVTILCDSGQRHVSRFHNPDYLQSMGLSPSHHRQDLSFVL